MSETTRLSCCCGDTVLEVRGAPIISAECHCESCRTAGAALEALPAAPPLRETNGATRMVLYRKDRVRCISGAGGLREHRLTPASSTRRIVAMCCHSPMFLEFQSGHWLSLYARRWPDASCPPLQVRTMLRDAPPGTPIPDDAVTNGRTQPLSFMVKLLGAWIAMGFRAPALDYVKGRTDDVG